MKRFIMLVAVAVVAGAMYVAASPASQQSSGPTLKQFNALVKKVNAQGKKIKALTNFAGIEAQLIVACDQFAIPINDFGDFQNGAYGYHYLQPDGVTEIKTSALDVSSQDDTGAGWFVFGDSTCGTLINGSTLRHAAARAGFQLPALSAHRPTLATHQH